MTAEALRKSWVPAYLVLASIWGSSFLFIKVGISALHPTYVTLGRVACGALALVVILLVTRDRLPRDPAVWGHCALLGTVGVALPFTLFGYGEQRVSSVLAGIWNGTTPLIVLPLAVLVFRTEKLTARRAFGLVVGFLGVLVVLGAWRYVSEFSAASSGGQLAGQLMCLGAAACYGITIPYTKRFVSGRPVSGASVTLTQLLVATAVMAVVAPIIGGAPPVPAELPWRVIGAVAALGAFGTGIAFVLMLRVLRIAGASTSSSVTYLVPVIAAILGVALLGERVSWHEPVGALVILLGVAIAQGVVRLPGRRGRGAVEPVTPPRVPPPTPAADPVARS